jgi:hypothetical protein
MKDNMKSTTKRKKRSVPKITLETTKTKLLDASSEKRDGSTVPWYKMCGEAKFSDDSTILFTINTSILGYSLVNIVHSVLDADMVVKLKTLESMLTRAARHIQKNSDVGNLRGKFVYEAILNEFSFDGAPDKAVFDKEYIGLEIEFRLKAAQTMIRESDNYTSLS